MEWLSPLRGARVRDILSGLAISMLLFACAELRKPAGPIPVDLVPAQDQVPGRPLVIVLPGRSDDLDDLKTSGIAAAIQRSWPQADVLLTGTTLSYYAEGRIASRLHDDVIAPARQRGYREIWLTGASLGGMGALLYERNYPHDVTGLVLYAPFMGNPSLIREIAAAGGPAHWDPGPKPATVGADNYQRELWRLVKSWGEDPAEAHRVWLMCGSADRFVGAARLIAPQLAPDHFIETDGGHEWPVWDAGAERVFARIAASERAP